MIWAAPYWLLGLGVVLMAWVWDWRREGVQEKNGGRWPHMKQLWANGEGRLDSNPKKGGKRLFFWLALAWLTVALARPQWGKVEQIVFEQSRDVLIALDLSKSMLAEDVKPSRLERGKLLLSSLLADLKGERVGLLLFAGTAFLQSPLSSDYEVLQEFMPDLSPQLLPQGGTDYGRMIKVALEAFSSDAGADRFLIVLSDGESRTENWREEVKKLKERKIRVIGLGIGTPEGSVIPDGEGGWLKGKDGAVVLSKLGAKTLQALAQETGGLYQEASDWVDIKSLIEKTVNTGQAIEANEKREERQAERFQVFLALAVLCGLISLWREFPVKPRSHSFAEDNHSKPWWKEFLRSTGVRLIFVGFLLNFYCMAEGQTPDLNLTNNTNFQLPKVIKELSEKKRLTAKDYSELAEETLRYGKESLARGETENLEGVIKDALQGVSEGEKIDRKAADWEKLRRELEELLKQQEQQKNQQQKQDQEQKEDQQKNNQESKGQNSSSEKESQSQESQGNSSEGQEEQKKEKGKKSSEKTQKVGGKKEKETPANASEAGEQQKLEQVKQKDSPARLFQLMEGGTETNAVFNEEGEW